MNLLLLLILVNLPYSLRALGKRNALNVIFNGFRHCKDGKHKESSYFRCVNQVPKCSGRLTLVSDQVTKYTPHSCQPEPSKLAVHIIRDTIKNTVATTSTGTKKAVAIHLRGYIDEEVRQELPPNHVLAAQARRHRKKTNNHPTNPTGLENLTVPAEFLATDPLHPYHNGELLLLWDSEFSPATKRSLLFSSKANLEILAEATNWVIDGTFNAAPKLFCQMVTIHALLDDGWVIGRRVPRVYGVYLDW